MRPGRMLSPEISRREDLVRSDVLEERIASIIKVTRMGELGTLAVISNRSRLRKNAVWDRKR
jgi:hypothetical protein